MNGQVGNETLIPSKRLATYRWKDAAPLRKAAVVHQRRAHHGRGRPSGQFKLTQIRRKRGGSERSRPTRSGAARRKPSVSGNAHAKRDEVENEGGKTSAPSDSQGRKGGREGADSCEASRQQHAVVQAGQAQCILGTWDDASERDATKLTAVTTNTTHWMKRRMLDCAGGPGTLGPPAQAETLTSISRGTCPRLCGLPSRNPCNRS
jgi:hypothetical protein